MNIAMIIDVFVIQPVHEHELPPAPVNVLALVLVYCAAIRFLIVRRTDTPFYRQLTAVFCAPLIGIWMALVLRPLRIYSVVTCRKTGWGTRSKIEVAIPGQAKLALEEW